MEEHQSFEDHVWMLKEMPTSPSTKWDIVLGTSCLITSVLGFFGNCIAFGFFCGKRDLASQLYKHICCIDIAISVCQIPVIQSFLKGRNPGMFNDKIFCAVWTVVHDTSCKIYPMAVLIMSTSRTINIVRPFYSIKKKKVIGALSIYLLCLAIHAGWNFLVGFVVVYGADSCYCFFYFDEENQGNLTNLQSSFMTAEYVLLSIEIGVPPALTLLSFLASTITLLSKSMVTPTKAHHRRAVITITIFTGVFLLCYLPLFTLCALYVFLSTIYKGDFGLDSGPFSNYFMFWYSWPIARCFLNTLNATLDVLIYWVRMKNLRDWSTKRKARTYTYLVSVLSRIRSTPN
jgi:hypothetical protein